MMPEPSEMMEQHEQLPAIPKSASLLAADVTIARQKIADASRILSEARTAVLALGPRYGEYSGEQRASYAIASLPTPAALKEASRAVEHLLEGGD
jgi:hypothetical protein